MRLEQEIQKWMNGLAKDSCDPGLSSVLRYDGSPLGNEMNAEVNYSATEQRLSPSRHRSAHEACRVLRSLVEPEFLSAGKNISDIPRMTLFPDLLLKDVCSGAFVIVEIKRSKEAAREFATELLAYSNSLLENHPGSTVFLVLVSTSWTHLERQAFSRLALGRHPVLALEFREESAGEPTPTLLVRSDLLPVADVRQFPAQALQVYTKTFWLPTGWRRSNWCINRIGHAVTALVHEAESGFTSGFLLVWFNQNELSSKGLNGGEVRVHVSMAVRNPYPQQEIPDFKNDDEAMKIALSNDFVEAPDDTAMRLLLDAELGGSIWSYSPEHEGSWHDLRSRLEVESASILDFAPFGDIGDQVHKWRTQNHHVLKPMVPDIRAFPTWHPFTWLTALESLIDSSEQEEGDPIAWHAFRRGEVFGRMNSAVFPIPRERNFGYLVTQARFAHMWSNSFAAHEGAPKLPTRIDSSGLYCDWTVLDGALDFAISRVKEEGELANYCFALGLHASGCYKYVGRLVAERHRLHAKNIDLPKKFEERVDKLERHYGVNVSAQSARPVGLVW